MLNDIEIRVLGALVEKDVTTPEYYPLSLNALVNACNQKSNREPVMELDDDAVQAALAGLQEKGLAGRTSSSDSRVAKFEHRLQEAFNFNRRETAVLCVLLLRGPQTVGELRGRTERMHKFEDLSEVQGTLQRLSEREPPLATVLPRQAGTKEPRYAQLFGGRREEWERPAGVSVSGPAAASAGNPGDAARLATLETEVAGLRDEVAALKQQLAEFRRQFE